MLEILQAFIASPTIAVLSIIFGLVVVVAGLVWVIYLQYGARGTLEGVSNNHLSGLPEMEKNIDKLVTLMEQQATMLQSINNNLIYIKAKVNGD